MFKNMYMQFAEITNLADRPYLNALLMLKVENYLICLVDTY